MDNQIKNIFKYALVLFIITALTASLLAWVNMVTADKIAQNAVLAENNALCEVMVNAESFEMLDEEISKDLSKGKGIGIADMMYKQLSVKLNNTYKISEE